MENNHLRMLKNTCNEHTVPGFFFVVIIQKIIFWRALQRYVALHGLHGANAQNMKADFFCLYKNMVEIWFDFGAQCLGQATGVNH